MGVWVVLCTMCAPVVFYNGGSMYYGGTTDGPIWVHGRAHTGRAGLSRAGSGRAGSSRRRHCCRHGRNHQSLGNNPIKSTSKQIYEVV